MLASVERNFSSEIPGLETKFCVQALWSLHIKVIATAFVDAFVMCNEAPLLALYGGKQMKQKRTLSESQFGDKYVRQVDTQTSRFQPALTS